MRSIKYRELKRRYELDGPEQTVEHLREALQSGQLRADDFSLRELAEATLGREGLDRLDPRNGGVSLLEAGDGIDTTAFSNITGQIVYSRIMEAYTQEAFVVSRLVDTIPTRLDGEKIPGIGRIRDEAAEVRPGMPFPSVGLGEDYIETPSTTKRGLIVPVTKEAIFFDRTNLILQRAAEVGEVLGLNKEKRLIDLVAGQTNNYKWKGTAYNTYYATADNGPWGQRVDGERTGRLDQRRPGRTALRRDPRPAHQRTGAGAGRHRAGNARLSSCGQPGVCGHGDPLHGRRQRHPHGRAQSVAELRGLRQPVALPADHCPAGTAAADAKKWWWVGDFPKAFAYMENWPITVTQAPANSEAEFNQDIVLRFKASERGAAAVINPRYVVRCTG